jgi:hypothetical protein|tara:strand:+ start:1021 stop:1287 length:267 start_codon:yes stop_codon:yes gene_type:complete
MKYKFDNKYFLSNDDELVSLGKNSVNVNFSSNFSQKVLSKLHILGKSYVSLEGEEVIAKLDIKPKKKVKLDEPKKTTKYTSNSNEKKS